VIHQYRETLLSTLPPYSPSYPNLTELLNKAYAQLPSSPFIPPNSDTTPNDALTHLLHLAPEGRIDGHVDNLDASGGMIIGICLGASRILRLEKEGQGWDVLLNNGSLYIQQ
jgi:alkylated DNA repair protein alkB family protein 7